jgi:NTE family protein
LQVALVAFEIARRHRFNRDLASLPDGVTAHVLPTGEPARAGLRQLNYRDFKAIDRRIERAYQATVSHLQGETDG